MCYKIRQGGGLNRILNRFQVINKHLRINKFFAPRVINKLVKVDIQPELNLRTNHICPKFNLRLAHIYGLQPNLFS